MNIKKPIFSITVIMTLVLSIAACQANPTQPSAANIQVTNITENELVYGKISQTKTFNQCGSSSAFNTNVQFSDSSTQSNQQQLVLGAQVTGGVSLPSAVKVEIAGSIEKHFSETQEQGQAHFESASIEVPAHTQQEYTIVWKETRRNGAVEYVENGTTKSISYSYRVGLELISASGKDIPCSGTPFQPTSIVLSPLPPSPTITLTGSSAPIIDLIEIPYSIVCDGTKYDVTIYFHDLEGDAYRIYWELLYSKKQIALSTETKEIAIDSQTQTGGAIFHDFVKWNISGDEVKIRVFIEDRAGLSGSKDFALKCSN